MRKVEDYSSGTPKSSDVDIQSALNKLYEGTSQQSESARAKQHRFIMRSICDVFNGWIPVKKKGMIVFRKRTKKEQAAFNKLFKIIKS